MCSTCERCSGEGLAQFVENCGSKESATLHQWGSDLCLPCFGPLLDLSDRKNKLDPDQPWQRLRELGPPFSCLGQRKLPTVLSADEGPNDYLLAPAVKACSPVQDMLVTMSRAVWFERRSLFTGSKALTLV
ncbi:hypothetical protein AAFF_G00189300 [Aldrovandia affinis]|uniref:Uncharacterized protein n=1 Tax=Aldrovandia affinis TaxID=143900 RepID=A0AAD7RJK8_9TELE|nr:hypothetical protein AAFF_G00189300 [Aldrovandia affinis]